MISLNGTVLVALFSNYKESPGTEMRNVYKFEVLYM